MADEKRSKPLPAATKRSLAAAIEAAQKNLAEAEEWLKVKRGIDPAFIAHLGLGVVREPVPGQTNRLLGRLCIPFYSLNGPVWAQFRCMEHEDCKPEHKDKYQGWQGLHARLYNLPALQRAGEDISICEGPLDAISLEACGIPAVAVPGIENWSRHQSRIFAGFKRVFIWPDGDTKGNDLKVTLMGDLEQGVPVPVPWGKDVNSVLVADGREAIVQLLKEAS